ncbi:MAG: hypothetical protein SF029_01750 [bacterium]|nr:hypothetical protein [bacterium]
MKQRKNCFVLPFVFLGLVCRAALLWLPMKLYVGWCMDAATLFILFSTAHLHNIKLNLRLKQKIHGRRAVTMSYKLP